MTRLHGRSEDLTRGATSLLMMRQQLIQRNLLPQAKVLQLHKRLRSKSLRRPLLSQTAMGPCPQALHNLLAP